MRERPCEASAMKMGEDESIELQCVRHEKEAV